MSTVRVQCRMFRLNQIRTHPVQQVQPLLLIPVQLLVQLWSSHPAVKSLLSSSLLLRGLHRPLSSTERWRALFRGRSCTKHRLPGVCQWLLPELNIKIYLLNNPNVYDCIVCTFLFEGTTIWHSETTEP